jgi:hypothetical protein
MVRARHVLLTVSALAAVSSAVAADTDAGKLVLGQGYPAITEAQKSIASVPFSPGSPAVVLLEAEQHEQSAEADGQWIQHVVYFRRVKLLTPAGVENHADFRLDLESLRLHKVSARTVLPDGTVVDAADTTFREKSRVGEDVEIATLRVAFPKAEVGAILDLRVEMATDALPSARWLLQEDLPVLDSRFVLVSPEGLGIRTAAIRLKPEEAQPKVGRHLRGRLYAWQFRDIEPLPSFAHLPAPEDVSRALVVYPVSFKDEDVYIDVGSDWAGYTKLYKKNFDAWVKAGSATVAALGKAAAEGKGSTIEKAEAIRRALREKVVVEYSGAWRSSESPDDLLKAGRGTSADLAGACVVALRAAGVAADVAQVRRRGTGLLPPELPLPVLFNDAVVRMTAESGTAWFVPSSSLPAGKVPWSYRGVLAAVGDGSSAAPVPIPDFKASDNRTTRTVYATLAADGSLAAEETETLAGIAAARWRSRLESLDDAGRKDAVLAGLREGVPGAEIDTVAFDGLDDPAKDLVVRSTWRAPAYASAAGARRILLPNVRTRESAADWSAADRPFPVDLDEAFEVHDTVFFRLPKEAKDVILPGPKARLAAGPVGTYESEIERRGDVVVATRRMVLNQYRFPAAAYPDLRRWFSDIAAADDRPLVVTLAEESPQ